MARARAKQANTRSGGFVCVECGRTFTRAASLGAHRRQAHGVPGASAQSSQRANGSRRASSTSAGAKTVRTRARTATSDGKRTSGTTARAGRRASSSARANGSTRRRGVDRDALLQALFPDGIPARENVIRSLNNWLDEADRLARMR
jgi:hypothetical protein